MENNNIKLALTGSEAKKLVSKEARENGVCLNVFAEVPHVVRKEVGGTGDPMDDTYGWEIPGRIILRITWDQFLRICEESENFSAESKKRFEEIGAHDSSSEHGTGLTVLIRRNDYGGKSYVYIG